MLIPLGMLVISALFEARRAVELRHFPNVPFSRPTVIDLAVMGAVGLAGLLLVPIGSLTDLALAFMGFVVVPSVFAGTLRGLGLKGLIACAASAALVVAQVGLRLATG
ncbi:hypothetical protein [Falsarthrobacter nasiphocae]|uniref:Uncharacterized protein n=1 Tax=Falsarthrobacter nasiphocae TaxID=189863 RepID=A0AAE3YH25_9MICC|nr:hypothetical protein [Falsarthrobacter nasiphocae]MDR6891866.1 hypothetical protein [Falsarthrobacter nasiphocae]